MLVDAPSQRSPAPARGTLDAAQGRLAREPRRKPHHPARRRDGRTKHLGKVSHQLLKGLAEAFCHFDEYQLAKYDRRQNKAVTMRDVLLLAHPKPKDEAQALLPAGKPEERPVRQVPDAEFLHPPERSGTLLFSRVPIKALRVEKPACNDVQRRRVHPERPVQFGTHIDFPGHFIRGAQLSESFGVENGVWPLCVVDITPKVAKDPIPPSTPITS